MRRSRIRFTIRRIMFVVLVAALASWGLFVVLPRSGDPTIAEQIAEANYKQARLAREIAELADAEFHQGVNLQNVATIRGHAALANSDMERAIDRFEWSNKMHARGYVSEATRTADRLTLDRAGFDADQARDQLVTLTKYAKDKQTKLLRGEIEKARADELAKLETYRIERGKRRGWLGF